MVQTYSNVIAKQREIGSAQILNPNYSTEVNQQSYAIDQERIRVEGINAQSKVDAIQKYKDDLVAQGYDDQGGGVYRKKTKYKDGSSKTTTITVDSDGNISKQVRKKTVSKSDNSLTQGSVSVSVLPVATNISSGGLQSMVKQEAYAKPIGAPDSDYKPVSQIPELNKGSSPVSESKTKSSTSVSSFTVPRTVSDSETVSVPFSVDTSKLNPVQSKSFGGSINARRVGEFGVLYDQGGNRLTPTPTDIAEFKIVGALGGGKVVAGTVAGLLSPARLGETLFSASNFNTNELNQQATQSKIKQGVLQVVKDPFKSLIADPVQTVVENPLFEAPKLATELVLLEGGSLGSKTIVSKIGSKNKYLKSDLQSSAYDLSRSSEQAQVFLKDNQINPRASSGGSEFFPIRSMTQSSGVYDLAGLEIPKPRKKDGILPLDEKPYFDNQPLNAKLVDDVLYYKIKDGQFVPSETQSGVYGDVQLARARSDSEFRSSMFDLKLAKSSRQSVDPNFVFNDPLNNPDIAVLGQRTLKGDLISDFDVKKLNAPLYENEVFGATRKTEGGLYEVPDERLILKKKSDNLIIPTGQTKIAQDKLIAGSLETSKQSNAFVVDGEVFVSGKEFNPKAQTLRTEPAGSLARVDDPYDLVVNKKSVQTDLYGSPVNEKKSVDLLTNDEKYSDLGSYGVTDSSGVISYPNLKDNDVLNVVDNSDKFKFDPVPDKSKQSRQVSSSQYANDKSFSDFKLSDATFDVELVSRKTVADVQPLDFPINSPQKSRLTLDSSYVYDVGSDSFVKKVYDTELNLDIKGKVTPQDFRLNVVPVQVRSVIEQPKLIPEIKVDQIVSPAVKSDVQSKSDQGLFSDQSVDQVQKVKSKITPVQSIDLVQVSQTESKLDLGLGVVQQPVQRVQPRLLTPSVEKVEVKPLFPKLQTDRQVKSGFGLFDVLVRKEGKFVKVGSGYSDLATAFNRGKQEVKDTARASFKVVSRLGVTQKLSLGGDRSLRYSKRDPDVIVQKREFRISSQGEKTEISRKGVFSQKVNRGLTKKNKNIFG